MRKRNLLEIIFLKKRKYERLNMLDEKHNPEKGM
jgi:hypothetical protein